MHTYLHPQIGVNAYGIHTFSIFMSSDFGDTFDTKHFIACLRDELPIMPVKFFSKVRKRKIVSLPLISWSDESYSMLDVSKKQRKKNRLRYIP